MTLVKFDELVHNVSLRPGMYTGSARYDVFVALLEGYAWGLNEGSLEGLRPWLLMRSRSTAYNIVWPQLLLTAARGLEWSSLDSLTTDEHAETIRLAGSILREFLDHKSSVGLQSIEADFARYMKKRAPRS